MSLRSLCNPSVGDSLPTCDVLQWKYRSRNKQASYKDKILFNFSPRLFRIPMKRDMIGYQSQGSEPRHTCVVPGGPWHPDTRLITLGKLSHDNWHCSNMFKSQFPMFSRTFLSIFVLHIPARGQVTARGVRPQIWQLYIICPDAAILIASRSRPRLRL